MKLLHSPASPFVRKVHMTLIETGQLDDVEIVSTVAGPGRAQEHLLSANPLGKIPALIRADAPTLLDSRVICRFLDDRADAGLYPATRLWEVLTLEATADGMMDAAVLVVYEGRFREAEQQSESWKEAQWARVTRSLDALESQWMAHLAAPLDMGQIALACALGYLDFRHADRNWRATRPALADWFTEISARPSMQQTLPQG